MGKFKKHIRKTATAIALAPLLVGLAVTCKAWEMGMITINKVSM